MGNFVLGNREEVEHIIECGAKIKVYKELLVGEQEKLAGKQKVGANQFTILLEMLCIYIKSWDIAEEEEGECYPINIETLRKLPDSVLTQIMEKVTGKTLDELKEIGNKGGNIFAKKEEKEGKKKELTN